MFDKITIASKEYKAAIKQLKTTLRNEFNDKLKSDCTELKSAYPNLDRIFILGSTPEWNDGEECTHDSSVYIENTSNYSDCKEYFECVFGWDEPEIPEHLVDSNKNLSDNDVTEIKNIIRQSGLENILEVIYETNFNVVIDFTGDEVQVTVEDYECGH
ncbi:hypothetical protein FDH34_gp156 [Serratia phage BF]|uniref:Uncharacterized protein n=2 Tax=Eneladusvirus BF TaxID=2560751 RepID=A0A7L8ZNM2_9CAUD|nr:hypothetical protein FDH34_gp156 [Serratia phage BF]AQW88681.1 hypothetical protein BF_0156 [Serratia phage BF]QOI71639.1 hypothetical protein pEaSNUABM47_00155 [Erwinia phage pEa_SNUABM_47]